MSVVHLNGVALIPGIDYTLGQTYISFLRAPAAGDDIMFTEVVSLKTGATHITRLTGDGSTFMFTIDTGFNERLKISNLLEDAYKHYDVPAVVDALDKLRVVLELVK